MKRDKLDRYRTKTTAVLTQAADVPFWCTLTPAEKAGRRGFNAPLFFRRNMLDRRRFRDFIRELAARPRGGAA